MKKSCNPVLFQRYPNNPILSAKDWPYPVNSVFNAGATLVGEESVLVARVEDRTGMSHLCVARSHDGVGGWRIMAAQRIPLEQQKRNTRRPTSFRESV